MHYQILDQLQGFKTQLIHSTPLGTGMQLAAWYNCQDQVNVCSNHHTLSLYVQGGYESYQKTAQGWQNGGGPDHFCLMPQDVASSWDIRGDLFFVHLYYTQQHIERLAMQIWDKEPSQIKLQDHAFVFDAKVASIYRQCFLTQAWDQTENHLEMSHAAHMLLIHLIKQYSSVSWQAPISKGKLSPYQLKYIQQWIEDHLDHALTLSDLAQELGLSEYHFAHLFTASMHISPHQYVMQQRLQKAHAQIISTRHALTDIALNCGFSSASHFSIRFKKHFGYSPSALRKPMSY